MTSPTVDKLAMCRWVASTILQWIGTHPSVSGKQQANFSVGVTAGGRVIISKVGGITSGSAVIQDLVSNIGSFQWYNQSIEIYAAMKFSELGNNNHGEMCVLAAADRMGDPLMYILCSGDNCPACADTLLSANVVSGNPTATGEQAGWSHPRAKIAIGSQFTSSFADQLAELHRYNTSSTHAKQHFTSQHLHPVSGDPQGRYERIV